MLDTFRYRRMVTNLYLILARVYNRIFLYGTNNFDDINADKSGCKSAGTGNALNVLSELFDIVVNTIPCSATLRGFSDRKEQIPWTVSEDRSLTTLLCGTVLFKSNATL